MGYGFPGGGMAARFDTDSEKIKRLRIERVWTQEDLADVAGIAYRTVQRIETTGKASMESIRALANAFGIDSSELLRPAAEGSTPITAANPSRLLVRINSGADLFAIVGGAHFGSVENEDLKCETEVELVGGFLQEMNDWGEMWNELEPHERTRQKFQFTSKLKELEEAGFTVLGTREKKAVRVAGDVIPDCEIAVIRVLRSTNPSIVRLASEESA
jgi:transcriptional regulator with XRE-family HTH domain